MRPSTFFADMTESEQLVTETLLDTPRRFELDGVEYAIWPETLGKSLMVRRIVDGIGFKALANDTARSVVEAVKRERGRCAELVAVCTLKTRDELTAADIISERAGIFAATDDGTLAELVTACLMSNAEATIRDVAKATGIERDRERMQRVTSAKESRGMYTFGGRTIYGGLIDMACERYGWTLDYVVWGISLANLRLMLADQLNSIYLTDAEMRRCHISNDRDVINADDPANNERIMRLFGQG